MEQEQFQKYLHNNMPFTEETLEQLHELTLNSPWFQVGWMLYLKNLKALNSPNFETVLKKVAIMVPDRRQLYKFLNNEIKLSDASGLGSHSQHKYQLDGQNNFEGDTLIDRFLSSSPGIRKKKSPENLPEETNNEHIIEKSVEESDDLITETLANIYVEQKNYEKALQAYEKLSLKYPEKSIYFASRIKEIEVIKNNT